MTRTGIYPGSFDPVTRGHEDLIERGLHFIDHLIVGIADNSAKEHLFSVPERVALLREVVGHDDRITVSSFDGLLVDFASRNDAVLVLRGLRAVSDFEYEFQMALMNRQLRRQLETVFMVPAREYTFLSSSLVREIASLGGDVAEFVHPAVAEALRGKFAR